MKRYILLDDLVAKIEKRIKEREEEEKKGWAYSRVKIVECEHILSLIDTLKVTEVDLDKEVNDYGYHYDYVSLADRKELVAFAKHFFELGMAVSNKAQKGEEV